MRGKRSKQYRKLMQQYSLTFNFREPYQVLSKTSPQESMYMQTNWSHSRRTNDTRHISVQDGPTASFKENVAWWSQAQYVILSAIIQKLIG